MATSDARLANVLAALYGDDSRKTVQHDLDAVYNHITRGLWDHVHNALGLGSPKGSAPTVVSVHTMQSRSQVLTSERENIVVLDQNFGRVSHQLWRLSVPGAAPQSITDAYILRLCAQSALATGRIKSAAILCLASEARATLAVANGESVTESSSHRAMRALRQGLQEQSVLAHELAHLVLRDTQDLANLMPMAAEAIERNVTKGSTVSEGLREEVVCDFAGTVSMMLYYAGRISNLYCIVASISSNRVLRTLQCLRHTVAEVGPGPPSSSEGTLRAKCLLDLVIEYYLWLGLEMDKRRLELPKVLHESLDPFLVFLEACTARNLPKVRAMLIDPVLNDLVDRSSYLLEPKELAKRLTQPLSAYPGGEPILYSREEMQVMRETRATLGEHLGLSGQ